MFAPSGLVTGITPYLVNAIVKNLPFIDSAAHLMRNFNLKQRLANEIGIAIKEIFTDSNVEENFKNVSYEEDVEMAVDDTIHDTELSDYSFDSDESVTQV